MRNLNADHLQAFVTVIEAGSFTVAARQLHLSQPAISLQVRDLETRCGVPLIDRDGKRSKPTAAGLDLYTHAKRVLAEHDAAVAVMRRHRDQAIGRIRIGMSTTSLLHVAGEALRRARAEHPTLHVMVDIGTSRDLSQAVDGGDLDLAIVTRPVLPAGLLATALHRDRLVAIFPLTQRDLPEAVTPVWLATQAFVAEARPATLSDLTRAWFAAALVEPEVVMRLEHLAAMRGAVEAGLGASIVPEVLVRERPETLQVRPLEPAVEREVIIIERSGATHVAAPLLKALLLSTQPTSANASPAVVPPRT